MRAIHTLHLMSKNRGKLSCKNFYLPVKIEPIPMSKLKRAIFEKSIPTSAKRKNKADTLPL